MIREIYINELNSLLELYTHLHETGLPENTEYLEKTWRTICNDENHHIIVNVIDEKIINDISSREYQYYEQKNFLKKTTFL